jgi:hypothetical protein
MTSDITYTKRTVARKEQEPVRSSRLKLRRCAWWDHTRTRKREHRIQGIQHGCPCHWGWPVTNPQLRHGAL